MCDQKISKFENIIMNLSNNANDIKILTAWHDELCQKFNSLYNNTHHNCDIKINSLWSELTTIKSLFNTLIIDLINTKTNNEKKINDLEKEIILLKNQI